MTQDLLKCNEDTMIFTLQENILSKIGLEHTFPQFLPKRWLETRTKDLLRID